MSFTSSEAVLETAQSSLQPQFSEDLVRKCLDDSGWRKEAQTIIDGLIENVHQAEIAGSWVNSRLLRKYRKFENIPPWHKHVSLTHLDILCKWFLKGAYSDLHIDAQGRLFIATFKGFSKGGEKMYEIEPCVIKPALDFINQEEPGIGFQIKTPPKFRKSYRNDEMIFRINRDDKYQKVREELQKVFDEAFDL